MPLRETNKRVIGLMKNELNNNDKHKEVKATKKWFMK